MLMEINLVKKTGDDDDEEEEATDALMLEVIDT